MQRNVLVCGLTVIMRKYLILITLAVALASCRSYRYVYTPTTVNNPFFTEKGNAQAAVYYSGFEGGSDSAHGKNDGMDFQAAYAIGNNFAVTGGYFFRNERDLFGSDYNYDESTVKYNRKLGEIGAGCFIPVGTRKNFTFNFYGGLGLGKFKFNDEGLISSAPYTRYHSANVTKWYLQPSLNIISNSKNFCIGFAGRVSFLRYSHIKTNYDADEQAYFFLDRLHKKTFTFYEQSTNIQFRIPGVDWLKAESCFAVTAGWNGVPDISRTITGSLGLVLDIDVLTK